MEGGHSTIEPSGQIRPQQSRNKAEKGKFFRFTPTGNRTQVSRYLRSFRIFDRNNVYMLRHVAARRGEARRRARVRLCAPPADRRRRCAYARSLARAAPWTGPC